ncbi:hypothetical protein D3C84_456070 [compost metagenome]
MDDLVFSTEAILKTPTCLVGQSNRRYHQYHTLEAAKPEQGIDDGTLAHAGWSTEHDVAASLKQIKDVELHGMEYEILGKRRPIEIERYSISRRQL